jgi:hypothetical protein
MTTLRKFGHAFIAQRWVMFLWGHSARWLLAVAFYNSRAFLNAANVRHLADPNNDVIVCVLKNPDGNIHSNRLLH